MSEEKKRTFESESLGLPPLQMVLVHHEKDRPPQTGMPAAQAAAADAEARPAEQAVMRIIEHLERKK
jgi:hypothetical protein